MLGRPLLLSGSSAPTYWFTTSDMVGGQIAVGPSGEVFTPNSERNADGTTAWKNTLTGTSPTQTSVASDSSGNSYVLAYVSNQTQLIKFSPAGVVLWARSITSSQNIRPITSNLCAVDSADNVIVVVSRFQSGTGWIGVVSKFNSTGALTWAVTSSTVGEFYCVTTDSSNNIYVAGENSALLKLNSSGTLQFARSVSFSSGTIIRGIAASSSGEIYVTGSVIGGGGLYNSGAMAKLSSTGTMQLSRAINFGSTGTRALSVGVGSDGSVYLSGAVVSSFRNVLIKYDSTGTSQWIREWYSSNSTSTADSSNRVIPSSSYLTFSAAVTDSGVGATHIGRIPLDGSLTKTTGPFFYGTNATFGTGALSLTAGTLSYTMSSFAASLTIANITPSIGTNSTTYTVYPL